MRRVLMSPTTKGKTMKFQSRVGTWVIFNQNVLLLLADDYELTVSLSEQDVENLQDFLALIEQYGSTNLRREIFGCVLTYSAEEDEIKVEETEGVSHAWWAEPEDFWKILASR